MTRSEFLRRYEATPEDFKAELIEGIVYVTSPQRAEQHGDPGYDVIAWLSSYSNTRPNVRGTDNSTVHLDVDNVPQPDISLRYTEGGQTRIVKGYIEGAPELVVEIAASSVSLDMHQKKNVYRRSGVQEYIVWRTMDGAIDWFALVDGEYVALQPDERGVIHSRVFPGLRLAVSLLLDGDIAGVVGEQAHSM
jgi:Uma2 family endonuclease